MDLVLTISLHTKCFNVSRSVRQKNIFHWIHRSSESGFVEGYLVDSPFLESPGSFCRSRCTIQSPSHNYPSEVFAAQSPTHNYNLSTMSPFRLTELIDCDDEANFRASNFAVVLNLEICLHTIMKFWNETKGFPVKAALMCITIPLVLVIEATEFSVNAGKCLFSSS